MKIIEIDHEKCINCLECVDECPSHLFFEEKIDSENIVSFADHYSCCPAAFNAVTAFQSALQMQ